MYKRYTRMWSDELINTVVVYKFIIIPIFHETSIDIFKFYSFYIYFIFTTRSQFVHISTLFAELSRKYLWSCTNINLNCVQTYDNLQKFTSRICKNLEYLLSFPTSPPFYCIININWYAAGHTSSVHLPRTWCEYF